MIDQKATEEQIVDLPSQNFIRQIYIATSTLIASLDCLPQTWPFKPYGIKSVCTGIWPVLTKMNASLVNGPLLRSTFAYVQIPSELSSHFIP